jgi:predicted AlkP superfamily phosphohydrolase/phosphomutase
VVGIDGATWTVLDPAMQFGHMPNLSRLVANGTRGVLRSMEPTSSAILWTTLATGKKPEKHGIRGFLVPSKTGEPVPVTSNLRRTKALWNVASEGGVDVGFLGWWVTWPAEAVRGFMASDYTWPLRKSSQGFATGVDPELALPNRTYPQELMRELEPYIKVEAEMDVDELRRLGISALPASKGYAVRDMLLKDISLGDMTGYLLQRFDPSLFSVYFDGFDAFCHIFWTVYKRYMSARAVGEEALADLPARERAIGEALDLHLSRIDTYLGRLMAHARAEDVVLVISDHGYGDNPGGGPVLRGYGDRVPRPHWHTLEGIVAAAGGPIREGGELKGATVLDIAPTVLALLGLPVAEDMDGQVLWSLMRDRFLFDHPIRWISSYEGEEQGDREPRPSAYDEGVLERLRALGYID